MPIFMKTIIIILDSKDVAEHPHLMGIGSIQILTPRLGRSPSVTEQYCGTQKGLLAHNPRGPTTVQDGAPFRTVLLLGLILTILSTSYWKLISFQIVPVCLAKPFDNRHRSSNKTMPFMDPSSTRGWSPEAMCQGPLVLFPHVQTLYRLPCLHKASSSISRIQPSRQCPLRTDIGALPHHV